MLLEGWRDGLHDPYLGDLTVTTLRLGFEATLIAVILGLPLACVIGLGRSRASRWGIVVANAGLGLPSVAVGVYIVILIPYGTPTPWGGHWLNTLNGMVLAQVVLSLPIVTAVTAIAIRSLPDGLVEQARAYGASGWQLGLFALREAKIGVFTSVIFALGCAFGEVGAVALIAGYSPFTTTLGVQVIQDVEDADGVPAAVEHATMLLAILLVLGLILVVVQHGERRRRRAPGPPPVGVPV
jgi:tungstate transport system permease protein